MLVREVMSTQFRVIPPQTTLQQAAQMMREEDFGFLPIGDKDHLEGTLTDRDIVIRAVADGMGPETPVQEVLTREVFTIREDDDIEDAAELMRTRQVRRLAVVDSDQRPVGVVSVGDIARDMEDDDLTGAIEDGVARLS